MGFFHPYEERLLLRRLAGGSGKAFEQIYDIYYEPLYLHALKKGNSREEVLDILQEVFSGLWEKRERLDVSGSLSAYLFQSVRFATIARIRKARSAGRYLQSLPPLDHGSDERADHRLRERLLREMIESEIAAFPPRMRQVFEMSRGEGMSHSEIAEQLGISEQSVRSHIRNALRILRQKFTVFLAMLAYLGN